MKTTSRVLPFTFSVILIIISLLMIAVVVSARNQKTQQHSAMMMMIADDVDDDDPLPCILNNGCVCDHNLPHLNFKDLQFYGTCINCTDQEFTGWNCESLKTTCVNNGVQPNPESVCSCPDGYSGSYCQQLGCVNSKIGTGPHSISDANPYTNDCTGLCKEGWEGYGCELCQTDAACASGENPQNSICAKSLAAVGSKLNWECNLTGFLEPEMTGNNFSYGPSIIQCENPTGWGERSDPKKGVCAVALYRSDKSKNLPPGKSQPPPDTPPDSPLWTRWLDAFMYCTLKQCSQQSQVIVTPPVYGPPSEWSIKLRKAFVYISFGFCGLLAVVVAVAPTRFTARVGPWIVLLLAIFIIASITIAASVSLGGRPLLQPGNFSSTGVVISCVDTTCKCADGSGAYGVDCKLEKVGELLPQLTGSSQLQCDAATGTCSILQSTVSYLAIKLNDCHAASCVSPSDLLRFADSSSPSHASANLEEDRNAGAGRISASAASDFDDDALFAGTDTTNKLIMFWVSTGIAELFALICILHATWYFAWAVPSMKKAWAEKVIDIHKNESTTTTTSEVKREGEEENSEEEHDEVIDETVLRLTNGTFDVPEAMISKFFSSSSSSVSAASTTPTSSEERTRVLHNLNFEIRSGRSLAILGGSGSGKTTSLNLIAALKVDGTPGGQLSVNNFTLDLSNFSGVSPSSSSSSTGNNVATYRSMVGFVHQDDRLIEYLTVRQCIFHAARMRLPLPLTDEQITELVDEVIDALGLTSCQDTLVGGGGHVRGCSGGERRRCAIACELVGYPRILLLDEPTSGLDALSARKVMQLVLQLPQHPLKTLQKYGGNFFNFKPIVIFSIHQPSADIYQMFDQVMVLVSGRKVIFDSARYALEESMRKCNLTVDEVIASMNMATTLGQQQNAALMKESNSDNANDADRQNKETGNAPHSPTSTVKANYNFKAISAREEQDVEGEINQRQSPSSPNEASEHQQQHQQNHKRNESGANASSSFSVTNTASNRKRDQEDQIRPQQQHRHHQNVNSYMSGVSAVSTSTSASTQQHRQQQQQSPRTPHSPYHERSGSIDYLRRALERNGGSHRRECSGANNQVIGDNDDDENEHRNQSLVYIQLQQLNEGSNVNPAELLLQVAIKLHEQQQHKDSNDNDNDDDDDQPPPMTTTTTMMTSATASLISPALAQFQPGFWHQLQFLFHRSHDSFTGMFALTAVHIFAAMALSLIFSFLYEGETLDVAGTEDKAGMITFLLLIVAFSSLSCLELLVSEGRVFASDYDRGLHGVTPYLLVKVLFDFLPHRIMPTAILAMSTYFPMGLRTDAPVHFLMFVAVLIIFSIWNVALCICIGLIAGEFGTGALACALVILWNTAFGGLMIQPASIPPAFRPFKYLSPQYFAYEAVMVNELLGQSCLFNPSTSSGSGSSSGSSGESIASVSCTEFILNLGLDPSAFLRDVISLIGGSLLWILLAIVLMKLVAMFRKTN